MAAGTLRNRGRKMHIWDPPPHVPYTPRHKRANRAHRHAIS